MKMVNGDGATCNCEKQQVASLEKAGWKRASAVEAPSEESKTEEKTEGKGEKDSK